MLTPRQKRVSLSTSARVLRRLSDVAPLSAAISRAPLRWSRSSRAYEGDLTFPDSGRRHAIVTTVTDNFMGLASVLLLSLGETLSNRHSVDLILLQAAEIAPLSPPNRDALRALWPSLRIVDVDAAAFLNEANMTRYDAQGMAVGVEMDTAVVPSKRAAFVKLNVLRLTQYDKVLLMDADLMVVNDFAELFDVDADLAAVPTGRFDAAFDGLDIPRWSQRGGFNSGVLLLGRDCRGQAPFNAAIDFLNERRARHLRDQSVLNHIFRRAGKRLLPHAYNHKLHPADPDMLSNPAALTGSKIIHFVGKSKWRLKDSAHAGSAIYDRFHALQARTGLPFVLEG